MGAPAAPHLCAQPRPAGEASAPWQPDPASASVMGMISEQHDESAAPMSAGRLAEAAAGLRATGAAPHELDALPLTLSHVGDAIDDLASGMLVLGETVARSSGPADASLDLDHLPPEARALCWHLHELAARLRAARASAATAHDWSRDLAQRRAAASELAGVPFA